jgi:hypothetical protein
VPFPDEPYCANTRSKQSPFQYIAFLPLVQDGWWEVTVDSVTPRKDFLKLVHTSSHSAGTASLAQLTRDEARTETISDGGRAGEGEEVHDEAQAVEKDGSEHDVAKTPSGGRHVEKMSQARYQVKVSCSLHTSQAFKAPRTCSSRWKLWSTRAARIR